MSGQMEMKRDTPLRIFRPSIGECAREMPCWSSVLTRASTAAPPTDSRNTLEQIQTLRLFNVKQKASKRSGTARGEEFFGAVGFGSFCSCFYPAAFLDGKSRKRE
jgi:hypothetical protein